LYDASNEQRTGMPLAAVPRAEVEVQSDWLVADVLQAGGFGDSNSFALATDQIQADVAAGEDRTVDASFNLFGIDEQGAIRFPGRARISWAEFLRACQAGLYEGDPTRVVVYPYGVAGGLSPDGLGRRSNGYLRTVTWQWMRWRKWRAWVAGLRRWKLARDASRAPGVDRSPESGVRKDLRPRGSEITWRDIRNGTRACSPSKHTLPSWRRG
jgi:hypothetical protein